MTRKTGRISTACGLIAWAEAVVLLVVAAFHAVWMVSPWPTRNWTDFARVVVGNGHSYRPPTVMVAPVLFLLLLTAYLLLARVGAIPVIGPRWAHQLALPTAGTVLLLRGVGQLLSHSETAEFDHWNLVLYSPWCIALASGIFLVFCFSFGFSLVRK
jgi:hypothetical protein